MTADTYFGLPIDVWKDVVTEARRILINCAKNRETITYSELSRQIKTASIPYYGYKMVALLDAIDAGEFAKESSMLVTLVVRKSDGMPGGGYFHNRFAEGTPIEDLRAYWQTEFERTCEDWQDE